MTDLLGQAFTAVTGRSVTGFEDYIKSLALVLSEIFGSDFTPELVKTVYNIYMYREEHRKLNN